MKNTLLIGGLAATLCVAAAPALAQSASLQDWSALGDVVVDSAVTSRLTTAYLDEAPLSASHALPYYDLEPALSVLAGSLAGDTIEGSGLRQSFVATAGTRLQFDWQLSTDAFNPAQADRAFVLIDDGALEALGEVAANTVSGRYSYTFTSAGSHALALVVMDVNTADGVSTLTLSNFNISAVPEPGSDAMLLLGLGLLAGVARHRRG